MQQPSFSVARSIFGHKTRYILVMDDNPQLRSLFARQIMLSCGTHKKSCAIYRVGERAEPSLTYFYDPQNPDQEHPGESDPDFMIFEAASPRHSLSWLQQFPIKNLTIVSDVMMPVDTEVGLPGLLNGLHDLKVAVNLIFMSSEPQNKRHVNFLVSNQQAYFLIKGSEAWNRLPEALVAGASRFRYQLLPSYNYVNPILDQDEEQKITDTRPAPETNGRRRASAQAVNLPMRSATTSNGLAYRMTVSRTEADSSSPPVQTKAPGFWARLFGRSRRVD